MKIPCLQSLLFSFEVQQLNPISELFPLPALFPTWSAEPGTWHQEYHHPSDDGSVKKRKEKILI